ncbi:MAG: hypothetical protein DRJ52_07100 [Thermoprotei archaeon]|nr:MAG: hypothetical protein DRJ52_07100 [Thermoprotei archaeon]
MRVRIEGWPILTSHPKREEILKELREEYGIELSREDFDKLLKGEILELPPQLAKIERIVVKIQQ